ncbi:MAG TPA: hypothetical protein VFQ45_22540, partial [Longimicrobium sp.]|nr:hypothetical protein [Longimicrobium sp.]
MTIHRRFRVIFGAGACALVVLAACDSPSGAGRRACGAGELRLEPGDAVALGPNEDVCSLASAGDAEYVLAYLDTRGLDAARDGNEAYLVPSAGTDTPDETFGIQITVEGAARGAAASAVIPHPVAEVPPAMDAHAAAGPLLSTAPFALPGTWAAGDTFSVRVPCIGDCGVVTMLDQHATVLSVLDDWIAFAAVDGLPSAQLAAFHETLRQGWPTVRQHALPLLRDVLDDGRPVTTPAGRLLVLIEPELGPFSGFAHTAPSGDQVFGFVRLKLRPDLGAVNMAGLMA